MRFAKIAILFQLAGNVLAQTYFNPTIPVTFYDNGSPTSYQSDFVQFSGEIFALAVPIGGTNVRVDYRKSGLGIYRSFPLIYTDASTFSTNTLTSFCVDFTHIAVFGKSDSVNFISPPIGVVPGYVLGAKIQCPGATYCQSSPQGATCSFLENTNYPVTYLNNGGYSINHFLAEDINGDYIKDLVFSGSDTFNHHLTTINGANGVSTDLYSCVYTSQNSCPFSSFAIADITQSTPSQAKEIIVGRSGTLDVYQSNSSGQMSMMPGFPHLVTPTISMMWITPVIGDLDGNGVAEAINTREEFINSSYSLYATSLISNAPVALTGFPFSLPITTVPWYLYLYSSVEPSVFPDPALPGSSLTSFTVGQSVQGYAISPSIYLVDSSGQVRPGWPYTFFGAHQASQIATGNIVGSSDPEIVVMATSFTVFPSVSSTSTLYAFNLDGTLVTGFPITIPVDLTSPSVDNFKIALGDLRGSGYKDIVIGNGRIAVQGNGNVLSIPTNHFQNFLSWDTSQIRIGDVDGDGRQEMVFIANLYSYSGTQSARGVNIYALDSAGNMVPGFPIPIRESAFDPHSGLLLTDLNSDNLLDLVVTENAVTSSSPSQLVVHSYALLSSGGADWGSLFANSQNQSFVP